MDRIFKFLRSVRVAVFLLASLLVLSCVATLVPQGLDEAWYRGRYPSWLARLILWSSFDEFFSSLPFIALAAMFWVNLFACTLHRFLKQLKLGAKGRYGPDILHAGLLVLVMAAAASGVLQVGFPIEMAVDDIVRLPGGAAVKVLGLEASAYPDGRPKDWITSVVVTDSLHPEGRAASIRVNKPLSVAGVTLYQYSWRTGEVALVSTPEGRRFAARDEEITLADGRRLAWAADLVDPASGERVAGLLLDGAPMGLKAGQRQGDVRLVSIQPLVRTVLMAGQDKAYPFVLLSFALISVGLTMILVSRVRIALKENKE